MQLVVKCANVKLQPSYLKLLYVWSAPKWANVLYKKQLLNAESYNKLQYYQMLNIFTKYRFFICSLPLPPITNYTDFA